MHLLNFVEFSILCLIILYILFLICLKTRCISKNTRRVTKFWTLCLLINTADNVLRFCNRVVIKICRWYQDRCNTLDYWNLYWHKIFGYSTCSSNFKYCTTYFPTYTATHEGNTKDCLATEIMYLIHPVLKSRKRDGNIYFQRC